jgi:hypothetical protein
MKKIVLLLMLLIPAGLFSQNLRFSIVGDPQISWMVSDKGSISGKGSVFGLNAGLGIDKFFTENYALSSGLTICNLGGKLSYPDPLDYQGKTIPANTTIIYKLQYISIPLGLKFKTNEIGYTTYFANLGLNPMINIRARVSDSKGITDLEDISKEIKLMNINYFINLGVQYSIGGSFSLIGGLGYSSGFTDITNRAVDKININTFTIKIGVLF